MATLIWLPMTPTLPESCRISSIPKRPLQQLNKGCPRWSKTILIRNLSYEYPVSQSPPRRSWDGLSAYGGADEQINMLMPLSWRRDGNHVRLNAPFLF